MGKGFFRKGLATPDFEASDGRDIMLNFAVAYGPNGSFEMTKSESTVEKSVGPRNHQKKRPRIRPSPRQRKKPQVIVLRMIHHNCEKCCAVTTDYCNWGHLIDHSVNSSEPKPVDW